MGEPPSLKILDVKGAVFPQIFIEFWNTETSTKSPFTSNNKNPSH